ncbi:MAG: GGDEF domain-containing protein [Desulfovibrio sp.]|jgi:diguanylate cyclase (GGDEF)-like protein|nr:GGDEF domain-containing protein [Desulfovibrio sp.]
MDGMYPSLQAPAARAAAVPEPQPAAPAPTVPESQPADGTALATSVVEHLLQVAVSPRFKDETPPEALRGIKNFEQLLAVIWATRKMAVTLAKGDLEYQTPEKGIIIGTLKAFQSNLKHLTWQTQRIAGGDYSHKVSFLGEFSEAFNYMAAQLAQRISLLKNTSEEYKNLSFRDALTGMYNRKAFMHFAEEIFTTLKPDVSTLVIADIDKFKTFNDVYGHLCGDEVLKLFADYLAHALRPGDICSRYGGEEFLMLLPGMPLSVGLSIGERLRAGVEALRLNYEGKELRITASFGVCETVPTAEGEPFDEFIRACIGRADENLYKAKEGGRNRVVG